MFKSTRLILIIVLFTVPFASVSVHAQGGDPFITVSPSNAAPGDTITITADRPGLLCSIYDSSGIDTVSESLGTTGGNDELTTKVPDWDEGNYFIRCTETGAGGVVLGTSNSVSFSVSAAAALMQPETYFTRNWSPPWLEPLSNHTNLVGSSANRVRRTITITRNGVTFRMDIDAENSTAFNNYVQQASVFFEVRSQSGSFSLPTDSVSIGSCPIPAAMSVGHLGWVLPEPPLENRLRESPSTSGRIIGAIPPGDRFEVLDGPECREGVNWWYVRALDGQTGWTAEGMFNTYYTETFPEVDVALSAQHSDPRSQSNMLYFYIDPQVNQGETHRYRSESDYGASIRLRAMTGQLGLSFWRAAPMGAYFRFATASAGNYTDWLKHDSGSTLADYAARVIGRSSSNRYAVYGTLELE